MGRNRIDMETKTSNAQKIMQLQGWSYKAYDDLRFGCFISWCEMNNVPHAVPLRLLTSHPAIYAWYCEQWKAWVEDLFFVRYGFMVDLGIDAHDLFLNELMDMSHNIYPYYPKPLIKKIKKDLKNNKHDCN